MLFSPFDVHFFPSWFVIILLLFIVGTPLLDNYISCYYEYGGSLVGCTVYCIWEDEAYVNVDVNVCPV